MTKTIAELVQDIRDAAQIASREHNPEIQRHLDSAKRAALLLGAPARRR
jgi:hypothetical protein